MTMCCMVIAITSRWHPQQSKPASAAGPLLVPAKPPPGQGVSNGTLAAARPGTLRHSSTKLPALTYVPANSPRHGLTAQIILPRIPTYLVQ